MGLFIIFVCFTVVKLLCDLQYLCSFNQVCHNPFHCAALKCYGIFLHTVIAGWDDKECIRAFEMISQTTVMIRHLETIVRYKAGQLHVFIAINTLYYIRCFIVILLELAYLESERRMIRWDKYPKRFMWWNCLVIRSLA